MRLLVAVLALLPLAVHAARIPIVQNHLLAFPVAPGELKGFALLLVSPTETEPGEDSGLLVFPENPPRLLAEEDALLKKAASRDEWLAILDHYYRMLPKFTREQAFGITPWPFRKAALARAERDANRLLKLAYDFACDVDLRSGNFGDTLPKGIERDIARILTGKNPLIIVVDLADPTKIYQVVSIAYQDEDGLVPLEHRLGIRLPKTEKPHLSDETHPFVYWRNPARPFPSADRIYNAAPITVGGRAEIKIYVRNPDIPIDWGRLFRRMLIANRFSQLNASVPELLPKKPESFALDLLGPYAEGRADALARGDLMEVMAQRQAYWDMAISQWAVRSVWLEEIVVQAVGPGIGRVYKSLFDLDTVLAGPLDDPDVKVRDRASGALIPAKVQVLSAKRAHWERTAMLDKRWYDEGDPLRSPRIQRARASSPFPDEDHCAMLMTWERHMAEFMDGHQLQRLYPARFQVPY